MILRRLLLALCVFLAPAAYAALPGVTGAIIAAGTSVAPGQVPGVFAGTSTFSLAGYTLKSLTADYGAVCDGTTDDKTAITNALNAAAFTAVELPVGTCAYSAHMQMSSRNHIIFWGHGYANSILKSLATNGESSIVVNASSNIAFYDFQVWAPNTTARTGTGNDMAFYINGASNTVLLNNLYLKNISSAGAMSDSSNSVTFNHLTVEHSWSDGLHGTGASDHFTVTWSKGVNTGDDSFASIGYGSGAGQVTNTYFADDESDDAPTASCFGIEGTTTFTILRGHCYRSGAAGIRLQSASSFGTGSVSGGTIQSNYLENTVTRADLSGNYGQVTMVADTTGQNIFSNTFTGNTIVANGAVTTYADWGFRGIVSGSNTVAVDLTNNVMLNSGGAPMSAAYSAPAGVTFTKSGNTYNGSPAP